MLCFTLDIHFVLSDIQSSGGAGDISQQTQENTSQLEMAIVSGGTRQQQKQHEVQQPQPRQEESPGASVGGSKGGRVPAHLFMEAEPRNFVQEDSNRDFVSGEDRSCLVYPCIECGF